MYLRYEWETLNKHVHVIVLIVCRGKTVWETSQRRPQTLLIVQYVPWFLYSQSALKLNHSSLPFCSSVTSFLAEYKTYLINCEKISSVCHLVRYCWKWISVPEKPFQANITVFQYTRSKLYALNVKYFIEEITGCFISY